MVLDTNIWLDWLLFDDARTVGLRAAVAGGAVRPVATAAMRAEFAAVIARPPFEARRTTAFGPGAEGVDAALAAWDGLVALCPGAPASRLVCRDADDQGFVDLAIGARAGWLLSRDRAVRALARRAWREHALHIAPPEDIDWAAVGGSL